MEDYQDILVEKRPFHSSRKISTGPSLNKMSSDISDDAEYIISPKPKDRIQACTCLYPYQLHLGKMS
ncbi:hypothetical protein PIB30_112302, partial [Stylosanthes scabra]|nr:hypothetical protein [Stylosanthes scabra]